MSSNYNINPKPCVYNCNTQIYWNTSVNEYWEVFTKKKHICPNRVNKPVTANTSATAGTTTSNTKPTTYYSKKPWLSQAKPKMSNSFELLQGSITDIQKKYEILSDIVAEYNGYIHGSQSHIMQDNSMSLIVYYEVPATAEGNKNREEVERKFENIILASARINY